MEHEREQRVKRTQGDYSFAFKMMVVHEVEKGQITYKQARQNMVFKEDQLCWYGYASTDNRTGLRICRLLLNAN